MQLNTTGSSSGINLNHNQAYTSMGSLQKLPFEIRQLIFQEMKGKSLVSLKQCSKEIFKEIRHFLLTDYETRSSQCVTKRCPEEGYLWLMMLLDEMNFVTHVHKHLPSEYEKPENTESAFNLFRGGELDWTILKKIISDLTKEESFFHYAYLPIRLVRCLSNSVIRQRTLSLLLKTAINTASAKTTYKQYPECLHALIIYTMKFIGAQVDPGLYQERKIFTRFLMQFHSDIEIETFNNIIKSRGLLHSLVSEPQLWKKTTDAVKSIDPETENVKAVQRLIELGADVNLKLGDKGYPLNFTLNCRENLRILMEKGANPLWALEYEVNEGGNLDVFHWLLQECFSEKNVHLLNELKTVIKNGTFVFSWIAEDNEAQKILLLDAVAQKEGQILKHYKW